VTVVALQGEAPKEDAMSDQPKDAKGIFLVAVEKPTPDERAAFLDAACAEDAALRQRVEALLQAHDEPAGILQEATPSPGTTSDQAVYEDEAIGARLGPYKLLQKLGEGGMGAVYLAEQEEPVRRRVALKIIKAGADSAHVLGRFEQERQALALMDHPNIAKVLDAGTVDRHAGANGLPSVALQGRPYFVMELVKGIPITRYCDQEHLTPRERLQLLIPVCQAVQHAHQKGIIHRDLKPSNVMVALYDGKPIPKVIDFGVAKATGQKLTERTMFTEVGQIIGTLEYMAPEQAELNNLDIDTRSDIYSLGVILYELLTGAPPFTGKQLRSAAFTEMLRMIREVDPPKPSTKLSHSEELPSIAAKRKLEPKKLTRLMHGDLDWIVMKALEKDRCRRYETATGLALDLERYLHDDPVLAGPPGTGYRLRKFLRRNQRPVLAAALVLLALVLGVVLSSWQAVRATRAEATALRAQAQAVAEKRRADEEAAVARAVNEFLRNDLLAQADPRAQNSAAQSPEKNITLRTILDRAAARIPGRFREQPLVEAAIRETIGTAYHGLGEYDLAQLHLETAVAAQREKLGAQDVVTLVSEHELAHLYKEQGQYAKAESLCLKTLENCRQQLGADDPLTLMCQTTLANVYYCQGQNDKAEPLYARTLEICRQRLSDDDPLTLVAQDNLAVCYRAQRKYAQAEPLYLKTLEVGRQKWGPESVETLTTQHNLAVLYQAQGRPAEAESLYRKTLESRRHKLGADHPHTLLTQHFLASLYNDQRRYKEAEPLYRKTLERRRLKLGPDHRDTLRSLNDLASHYWARGQYARAEPLRLEALEIMRRKLGADHPDTLECQHNLAALYDAQGQDAKAEALYRQTLEIRREKFGNQHPLLADDLAPLGRYLLRRQRYTEAEPLLRDCLQIREKNEPNNWRTFSAKAMLGGSLLGQHRYAEAEPLLVTGYEGMKAREKTLPEPAKVNLTEALERILRLYDAWGKNDLAASWRKKAPSLNGESKGLP
jgi:serine/threonine protein kinase/Tfp pilus assembly protein PilF